MGVPTTSGNKKTQMDEITRLSKEIEQIILINEIKLSTAKTISEIQKTSNYSKAISSVVIIKK